MQNSFILKGCIVTSISPTNLQISENSYIICVDGISQGIYDEIPQQYNNLEVYDYNNSLIIPGLVDLHVHAPQYPFRGTNMDLELMDWLELSAFPQEAKYENIDYAKKAYSIFVDDLKKSATTRAVIFASRHTNATIELMNLLEKSGLCSYVGKVNMDRNAPYNLVEKDARESIIDTLTWLDAAQNKFHNTKPILTPRFIPSCSDQLLSSLQDIQKDYDLPLQSHLSENPSEIDFVQELCPKSKFYGDAYDIYGLFGLNHLNNQNYPTIMAHCVYSREPEIALMKKNGVFVAHCPTSNMDLSSGIAPIRKYLDLNLNIGLGTDIAGGHSNSIFHSIVDTIGMSKLYWRLVDNNYKAITFKEAFYLATKGGGSFFGKVGSFEKGYAFDALVLDDQESLDNLKLSNDKRLERFVYLQGDNPNIKAKFVNGHKII